MFNLGILDTEYINHSKKIAFCNMTVNFFLKLNLNTTWKKYRNEMERKVNNHKSNNALDL